MEDPEGGASAPHNGASDDAGPPAMGHASSSGRSGGRATGATPGTGEDAGDGARKSEGPQRKRRKRRRGRKLFARDTSSSTPEIQNAPQAAEPVRDKVHGVNGHARPRPNGTAYAPIDMAAPQQGRPKSQPVYAALDLGTNNCRLLVAIPGRPGQFRVIDAFSRIVRLGEGLSTSGRLGDAAMTRAVEALKVCAEKLGTRDIRRARLIATEACRSAENGAAFLARVRDEAGLDLEIIDRRTEARLAVSGCGSLVERDTDGVVLFDIGGGSSEIALVDLSRHRSARLSNHIVSWTSLPVGVVSLAERFGGREVTRAVFDAMVADVAAMLDAFKGRDRLAHVASGTRFHLLGTSGTVTTLAGVHLGLERYDRRRVDGLWLEDRMVDDMIERLLGWDFEQRVANPCIGADRADLVLAGCAILEAIRRYWPSPRLRVADRGLREGILSELMAEDGVWRRRNRWRGGRPQ